MAEPALEERAPTAWHRTRDGRVMLLLFVVILGAYLATATYSVYQVNDTKVTAVSAWSLGTQGTLAIPSEWGEDLRWTYEGRDGRLYSNRFPGAIFWGAGFYAVAEVVVPRGEVSHPDLVNFGPAGIASATAAALASALIYPVFRRLADRRLALSAAVVFAFGTGTWSVSANALWTHGPGQLALVLGMLALSAGFHAPAGVAFGASILCRPHLAVAPAVAGIWAGIRRRSLRPVLTIGVLSGLGLLAMSIYSQVLFGTWLPVTAGRSYALEGVVATGAENFGTRTIHMLVNPARGLLIYTPVLLLLLPGIARGWRAAPAWVRSSAIGGVLYLVVQLRANTWHGGADYFGNRLALETLTLAAPLLLLTFQRFASSSRFLRGTVAIVATGSIVLHGLGATVLTTGLYGDDDPEAWERHVEELCEEYPEDCP